MSDGRKDLLAMNQRVGVGIQQLPALVHILSFIFFLLSLFWAFPLFS